MVDQDQPIQDSKLLPQEKKHDAAQRFAVLAFIESNPVNMAVILVVLLDLVFFFLEEFDGTAQKVSSLGFILEGAFVVVFFSVEMSLKFYAYTFNGFFKLAWNVIDLFIVVITILGFILLVVLEGSTNLSEAASGATTIRLLRIFRIVRLLRVFHAIRALTELTFTFGGEDRIDVPAKRCSFILTRLRHVLQLRYVKTVSEDKVAPTEIAYINRLINRGLLRYHFLRQGLDTRMESFLTGTLNLLPTTPQPRATVAFVPRKPLPNAAAVQGLMNNRGVSRGGSDTASVLSQLLGDMADLTASECGDFAETAPLQDLLDTFEEWGFDALALAEEVETPLYVIGFCALKTVGVLDTLHLDERLVARFLWRAEKMHNPANLYHNSAHVSDVTHAVFYFLNTVGLKAHFHQLEILAALLAAIVHDLEHPGVNNAFMSAGQHEWAIRYNDISVIENHSIAKAFELLDCESCNFLASLPEVDRQYVRHTMIRMVLGTDNAQHFTMLGHFKSLQMNDAFDFSNQEHRMVVLETMLHVADISNPAKPPKISHEWSRRVQNEFWSQGDQEKAAGRAVSGKFFDRDAGRVAVAVCQLSFIEFLVQPLFAVWLSFIRDVCPRVEIGQIEEHLVDNKHFWASKALVEKNLVVEQNNTVDEDVSLS